MNTRAVGRVGEEAAVTYLTRKGYRVIERNYYTRIGEIDLICRQGRDLVFVEVKARTSSAFGRPEESITARKVARLRQCVAHYLDARTPSYAQIRMDAIAIDLLPGTLQVSAVRHYQNIG